MPQLTTAGRLLADLHADDPAICDAVVAAAGVAAERADSARVGEGRLSLSEQLRLAEATPLIARGYARTAARLRAQVLAARTYESGDVSLHMGSPAERWERSNTLRR